MREGEREKKRESKSGWVGGGDAAGKDLFELHDINDTLIAHALKLGVVIDETNQFTSFVVPNSAFSRY